MMKSCILLLLMCFLAHQQSITPYYILPVETTKNIYTSYSFLFYTDTAISNFASVGITFPSEFDRSALMKCSRVRYSIGTTSLMNGTFTVNNGYFLINVGGIPIGNITIVIDNILNPTDYQLSSHFTVVTLFKTVPITTNIEFGKTMFTIAPVYTTTGLVKNNVNTYIEQGSSWIFSFTLSKTYPSQSSLRFVFPEGFISNKVQCNVSGIVDPNVQTRVFPSLNVYDCLNLGQALTPTQTIVLSGLVNPNFQMTAGGFQVHVLQENNIVIQEKITSVSTVPIKAKTMSATVTIPNNFRNNSVTYIFQVNMDSNLYNGDYFKLDLTGIWTFYANQTRLISGVNSDPMHVPTFTPSQVTTSGGVTTLILKNFTSILKSSQIAFYLPLRTPLSAGTYTLSLNAYKFNGMLVQTYTQSVVINKTTGYIRQMKLHPMQRAIKLPVGQTGPLEIILGLQNNLPKTNVLTYGQIVIEITPNMPAPIVNINGVPKCYFYSNIPASNCTFDSASDPTKTIVTIFTPKDFNFQSSEVPLTITTEGYTQTQYQGITLDTLVKRYQFHIQFYTQDRPIPIPTEVIFDEWIPDAIPISTAGCSVMTTNQRQNDHLKCTVVTPNQVLNSGHIHIFRLQFGTSTTSYWWQIGWPQAGNTITPNYPCLVYGTNVSAVPYAKCDFNTYWTGPNAGTLGKSYVDIYGLSTIPGGSTITFEIPNVYRENNGESTNLVFSILEQTWGYNSPIVTIYTQTIDSFYNTGMPISDTYYYQSPAYTLSNSVINKVTTLTLTSYDLQNTGISYVILEVDQTAFPNIGRQNGIACGVHTCSKFDLPIQYFILYPSRAMARYETLVFPNITTPAYSGVFTFRLRIYQNYGSVKKVSFYVTITPDTITTASYSYNPSYQTITTLYPNSDHYYKLTWTTVNALPAGGAANMLVTINNIYTLTSTSCLLSTAAPSFDGRGINCQVAAGSNQIYLYNLGAVSAGTSFTVTVWMRSTSTTATVSPTANIQTFWSGTSTVDQILNLAFGTTPLTNTNLTTLTTFSVPPSYTSVRPLSLGYFSNLIFNFQPRLSGSVINGSKLVFTTNVNFYPYSNALNLPLICQINSVRFTCTYTINPFVITIVNTNNTFTTSNNIINITTEYLAKNGIYYPASQGRYYLAAEIINQTSGLSLEKVEQYVDILPADVAYFNASWAHKDIGVYNIYTFEFKNGITAIPSYNDAANAGRIYIGFPLVDSANNAVFASNLGYATGEGTVIPCYFVTGVNMISATATKALTCKLRVSQNTNLYMSYVEIINFAAIPAGTVGRIIMGRIMSPASKQIDINFILKVTTQTVSTKLETPLYQTYYNMFIDMLAASITNRNEVNSSTTMFQPGSGVGDLNKYVNVAPYTGVSFSTNDWFIMELDPQFPLSGSINNCLNNFYQYCIVYPTINWLAVKIGNTTLIPLYAYISQLPISISRIDTTYKCYTYLSGRFSQSITYTITAAYRWLEIRGLISGFTLSVLGSQNKLNIGQKNVEVLLSFNVTHKVPVGGTIEIQFPSNPTLVPNIKSHCRSAVTLGSSLMGYNTGKPTLNVQGDVGCLVQNTYSWLVTGFDLLPAGSQVKIFGVIDLPLNVTTSLGNGYIATYSNQDATSAFLNAKTIDYLQTNFPLSVQNLTWKLDGNLTMVQSNPLRINYLGEIKFVMQFSTNLQPYNSGGYIGINLARTTPIGVTGGFTGISSNLVCTINSVATNLKFGCYLTYSGSNSQFYAYQITTFEVLPANTLYEITMTTQNGNANEGFNYPSVIGLYRIETEIMYQSGATSSRQNDVHYVEVYGPDFTTLFFNSSISMPNEFNFIQVIFTPASNIAITSQLIIYIPTVTIDGVTQFPADLGMGYKDYDNLVFDLYESGITSMTCKVYTGDSTNNQPVKIVCSNFNAIITTAMTVKIGFWVVNPSTSVGMAIPVQVYEYDQVNARKTQWSIVEAGIKVIPITQTPTQALGNFAVSSTAREQMSVNFQLTTRNTQPLVTSDWYILKFNFDLRVSGTNNGKFNYNIGLASVGDVIFMRNCQTILLRVGTNALTFVSTSVNTITAQITGIFYNPSIQLSTQQSTILAYAIYNSNDDYEKIIHNDFFPVLVPNEPSSPSFSLSSIYGVNQRGQRDDYRLSFTMSSTATNATKLVKMISIQFPTYSTYDFVLVGSECIETSSSVIEVQSCRMDTTTNTIWITPVISSAYTSSSTVIIETVGYAIQLPVNNLTINVNQFVIRYYTWPDGTATPPLFANNDDYVFLRQDSSNIPSSTITYNSQSGSYYNPHSSVSVPQQVFVSEFLPSDTNVNANNYLSKSPLHFKMTAMATFASLQGSANYHSISLTFSSYYSTPTLNQTANDLNYYIAVCQLNGYPILKCYIQGGIITMNFQQPLTNGAEFSVKFTIVNPLDERDEGFTLINTNSPMITLPIQISIYGGSTYYMEPEPFPTFYKTSGAYPSMGISSATVVYGTQVYRAFNYLEFNLKFSRSDINGLVLEIPVVGIDGTPIYSSTLLLGLPSGSSYPCSVGPGINVFCYYVAGSTTGYGKPTRIYITNFAAAATLSLRMLFSNPDIIGVFPTFKFKAFGGAYSVPQVMGSYFQGEYTIIDAFKTYPEDTYYTTSTCNFYPRSPLWSLSTVYDYYISDQWYYTNNYAIIVWPLVDSTYGEVGDFQYNSAYDYDYFSVSYTPTNRVVYVVKKLTGTYNPSGNYFRFGDLRQKHHLVNSNSYTIYLLGQPAYTKYACTVSQSWVQANYANNYYGQFYVRYVDVQNKLANTWSWHFMSINTGTAYNYNLAASDASQMIISVQFAAGRTYSSLGSSTQCTIESGVIGNDYLNPVTCTIDSANNQILIKNIYKFKGTQLNIYYTAYTATSQSGFDVTVSLWANTDAFNNGGWYMMRSTTNTGYNLVGVMRQSNPGYVDGSAQPNGTAAYNGVQNSLATMEGWSTTTYPNILSTSYTGSSDYSEIISVSSTQLVIRLYRSSDVNLNSVYRLTFRFYVERLNPSVCNSVTYYNNRYGWNFATGYSMSCTSSNKYVRVSYMSTSGGNVNWAYWYAGDYYDFYLNFNSISGDVSTNPLFLFAHASVQYQTQTYYYSNLGMCGCLSTYCLACTNSNCPNCNSCGNYYCCWYYQYSNNCPVCGCGTSCCSYPCGAYKDCRYIYGYDTFMFTGTPTQGTPYQSPTANIASGGYIGLISNQFGVETELSITMTGLAAAVGPSSGNFLLLALTSSGSFTGGNPFPYTTNSQLGAYIDCLCVTNTSASISVSATTSFTATTCVRYIPAGLSPSIAVYMNVNSGGSISCYFPGFQVWLNTGINYQVTASIESMNHFKVNSPLQYWNPYQTTYGIGLTTQGTNNNFQYVTENGWWTNYGNTRSTGVSYNIYLGAYYWLTAPTYYFSTYGPTFLQSTCNSGSYYICRAYTSFINRRNYLVMQPNWYLWDINIGGNYDFPVDKDYNNNYGMYIALSYSGYYYHIWTSTRNSGYLSENAPATSLTQSIFGSTLAGYPSSFSTTINVNGFTVYSTKRTQGPNFGSFMRLTLSGFTSIFGCGAMLSNDPYGITNPLYCQTSGTNVINIYSRNDIAMTGSLYITFQTTSVPTSTSYTFEIFTKYYSGSNYAKSLTTSSSFGRSSAYTLVPTTSIEWRKQVYKEYRTDAGPIRFTMNNNYPYVSTYVTASNAESSSSTGLIVVVPGSVFSNNPYICFMKQYLSNSTTIYRSYEVPCSYSTTNTVLIKSIPSHIRQAIYTYDFAIYLNINATSMLINTQSSTNYLITFRTVNAYSSYTIINEDYVSCQKYQAYNPITLNSIYVLTKEAAALNSLFVSFTMTLTAATLEFLEFQFDNLDLNYFGISNGQQLPCFLSAQFTKLGSKSLSPRCFGFASGLNKTNPLKIRVLNFGTFTSGTTFTLSFDGFNNPPTQALFLVPINMRVTLQDRTNSKAYTSYFKSIYFSDSVNVGPLSNLTGTYYRSNSYRGTTSTNNYYNIAWPFDTLSNNVSQKMVLKIGGGITCCQTFTNLVLSDSQTGYTLLWTNTMINMSVYLLPSKSVSTGTNLFISNVNNPQCVNMDTYNQLLTTTFIMYNNYKTTNIANVNQFSFSSYSMNNEIYLTNSQSQTQSPYSFNSHQNYPMTYDLNIKPLYNSYANRNISYMILYFTGGVKSILAVYTKYNLSPNYYSTLFAAKFGYNSSSSTWFLNITGFTDFSSNNGYNFWFRTRFYPNANTLSYNLYVYNYNGQQEFTTNSGSVSLSSGGYSSSYSSPTTYKVAQQRYVTGYYEMKRKYLYAAAASTTNKLMFKFTPPYNISQIQSIQLISSSNTDYAQVNPSNGIYCVFQPTYVQRTVYGTGLFTKCSYSNGIYSVNIPVGGLTTVEYLLTIFERKQLISSFSMPTTPKRIEISLIYLSSANLFYGDVYTLDFTALMQTFSVTHTTLINGNYDMLGLNFKPAFTLSASSTTAPVTQSVLQLQIQSKYYLSCAGVDSTFANDGMPFYQGVYYSHYSSPAVPNANTRFHCGQYSQNYAPIKLAMTDYGTWTAGTTYYVRFPLLLLPSTTNSPLVYTLKLIQFTSNSHYPIVVSQYTSQNIIQTSTGNWYNQNAYMNENNKYVQQNLVLGFVYNSYNILNQVQTLVKIRNNIIPAFTSITTLSSLSSTDFNYEYYPNINLCVYVKSNSNTQYGFNLGTFPTSSSVQTYRIDWVYSYYDLYNTYQAYFYSIGTNYYTTSINYISSWSTSSFVKNTGLQTTNSWGTYTISFSAAGLAFPEGSSMIVTFTSDFILVDQYCLTFTGFIQGVNANSNLICKRYSLNQILIAGYSTIAAGASLSFSLYLQIAVNTLSTYYPYVNIVVSNPDTSIIINANTNTYTLTITAEGPYTMSVSTTMNQPYTATTAYPLYITYQLKTNTLVNGDWIQIDFGNWVLDTALLGTQIFNYKSGSNVYWVPTVATKVSANIYKVPVYSNYSMTAGTSITLRVDTLFGDSYVGLQVPQTQWNYFKIYAYKAAGTLVEQQVARVWVEPYEHISFNVNPVLKYVGASTLYEFTVTPNISASAGDTILIEFRTNDLQYNNLFSNNLGLSINAGDSGILECNELNGAKVISPDFIYCEVFAGNNAVTPSIPTTISIPIKKSIAANTLISLNILNMVNPSQSLYPVGVTFKLANSCSNSDGNNLCTYYKSTYYLSFNNVPGIPGVGYTGSLTFNPNYVSATNTQHTISAGYPVNAGDYLLIKYYPEVKIPSVCTLTSNNGYCYSYPNQNTFIIKSNTTYASTFTFTFGGMTNLYQYQGSNLYTEIWRASTGTIYVKYNTGYTVNWLTSDPTTSNPMTITFAPTLTTNNYFLMYGFNNIALIQISYLLQNANVQQIYVQASGEISIDQNYCNATMQSLPNEAKPYPFRLICTSMSSNAVRINFESDFPTWNSAYISRTINLYLKFQISTLSSRTVSGTWYAYSFTDPTSTSTYYQVARASGTFPIVPYQTPYLYVINFPTKAFSTRTCKINQQCMFYGYLLPSTSISDASVPIRYMTFTVPKEFGYSNLQTYDSCRMVERTTIQYGFSCAATRTNSSIVMKYDPTTIGVTYDYNYQLISIDHSAASLLFTAPAYPGNHYQMLVNLWTAAGVLVQSQYINLTTVYSIGLNVPTILASIPLDASTYGLFQFQFQLGVYDVLPAYVNSASNIITSAIQLIFSNSFDADLGTGLPAGAQIPCLPVSGLTFNTMGKLTCKIYPSVSTITYPTIIVTGYDKVLANTVIKIRLANLKSLPVGVADYIKLGVSLTYYNYGGTKGYIYEPVSFVVGPTTVKATPKSITVAVAQSSSNIVGEFSNYTFTATIGTGFAPVTTSDFVAVQFPANIFEGKFNQNAKALCSLAASNVCNVFGLANIVYIQPSTTISSSSLSFTINSILNAAYAISYLNQSINVFTVVGNKVNAFGSGTFLKFTKPSTNASAIFTSVQSIYGGDSGINYNMEIVLNSYLPADGKISVKFPNSTFASLFDLNSQCVINSDSQLLMGPQAYCQILNPTQFVIVPNGVLLSPTQSYYITITNLTNPNFDLSSKKFTLETFYSSNVYAPLIVSSSLFDSPILKLITVKACQFQVTLSAYNANLPSDYSINLICPTQIKASSELRVYLSWNPTTGLGNCSGNSDILYSKECDTLNSYNQTVKLTYLSIYLRDIVPQKVISVTGTIPNGDQGTYTLTSTVAYAGFVYLASTSNQFYITSNVATGTLSSGAASASGTSSSGSQLSIKNYNYPLNKNYEAIYTFGMTNPNIIVSNLEISVDSNIVEGSNGIVCGYQTWVNPDNYFNLLSKKGSNSLNCTMNSQKIKITGLTSVLTKLGSSDFLYLTIYGLKNADKSSNQYQFSFSFIDTSSTLSQILGIYSMNLSYTSSNPPAVIQIINITLSNQKLYVLSNYNFSMSTVNSANISITQNSSVGLIVKFPNEYLSIWSQIPIPSQLNLTINNVNYIANTIQLSPGFLFAKFSSTAFSSQVVFTSFNINFQFRNPNSTLDCSGDLVFTVSLYDFKANSMFAETLANKNDCLNLTTRLFSINITGNTKIQAGTAETFIVSLEQPAKSLTITPSSITSAISFSPKSVVFAGYTSSTQSFTISTTTALAGSYNITFAKSEGDYTYYNDIQFTTINVYAPLTSYAITIQQVSSKSIGNPILIPITLDAPNQAQFSIITNTSCNSDFTFNPQNITIFPKTTNTSFSVQYSGSTVPPPCQVDLKIASITSSNYVLAYSSVYISASLSIDKSDVSSPMYIYVSYAFKNSTNVGHSIISQESNSKDKDKYKPVIYTCKSATVGSNTASFTATTSEKGVVYYAVILAGTPSSSVSQTSIYNNSVSSGVTYGNSTAQVNASQGVNIRSNLPVGGLLAQTNYILAVYLNSSVGISEIYYLNFSTSKSSNGATIKIAFTDILNLTSLATSLSNVWRIDPSRISCLTKINILDDQKSTYQTTVMNKRSYVYEIVVGPDQKNDITSPLFTLNSFIASSDQRIMLLGFVPQFINSYTMSTREIILAKPRVRNSITVTSLAFDSLTATVSFWEVTNIFAIIVPAASSTQNALSSQILAGMDQSNTAVVAQHYISIQSDDSGSATFKFTNLKDNTQYNIYLTAQCVLPYNPRLQLSDAQILTATATTQINFNLLKNKDLASSSLKDSHPDLSDAIFRSVKSTDAKNIIHGVDKAKKIRSTSNKA